MNQPDQRRSLAVVRGPYEGGTLIRRSSGRFRIMTLDGRRARLLGLPLDALPWFFVGWMTSRIK